MYNQPTTTFTLPKSVNTSLNQSDIYIITCILTSFIINTTCTLKVIWFKLAQMEGFQIYKL